MASEDYLGDEITAVNVTAHYCTNFLEDVISHVSLTNCLFVNVTNFASWYFNNTNYDVFLNSDSGVFTAVGAGSHYLPANSPYRGVGSTNIDAGLLADLKRKTTWPPLLFSNVTAASTNILFQQQVARETNGIDLGYAYDPLDYVISTYLVTNGTVTISLGTAIGYYDNNGICLDDNSSIICLGTPTVLNWFADYRTVQEQPLKLGSGSSPSIGLGVAPYRSHGVASAAQFRFTAFSRMAPGGTGAYDVYHSGSYKYTTLDVRDCSFWGGGGRIQGGPDLSATFKNNLFERATFYVIDSLALDVRNNLFKGGSFTLDSLGDTVWVIKDTAFDNCSISPNWETPFDHGHNAYINSTRIDASITNGDIPLTNFNYVTGPLGNYYQLSTNLINKGSVTNAGLVGLYHYTTITNLVGGLEIKETNSTVDIGLHYIALNSSNQPIDTDNDGTPDYVADTDGNGLPDSWELQYFGHLGVDGNDDPDGDWITNLQEYLAGSNPVDRMVVAWGENSHGQCNVPTGLRGIVAIEAGDDFCLAVRSNGTVVAWGGNTFGGTNVPSNLTNVIGISANWNEALAHQQNGIVVQWGLSGIPVPNWATNFVGISVGGELSSGHYYALGLRSNGTVLPWGESYRTNIPADWTNIVAIATAQEHKVGIRANGTIHVPENTPDYCFPIATDCLASTAPTLSDAAAVSAKFFHALTLRSNSTVVAWGNNQHGQANVPPSLSNVVAIAAGNFNSMALKSDGSVVTWGDRVSPAGLSNIVGIAAGWDHCLTLRSGRLTPVLLLQPSDQAEISGANVTFTALGAGLAGVIYQWQFNGVNIPGATNATLTLTNAQTSTEGTYRVVLSTGAGSLTSSNATFTLITPPVITGLTQPGRQWLPFLSNITLAVTSTAPAQWASPLTYQWKLKGTNIAGATSPARTFSGSPCCLQPEGDYSITVTNVAGSTNVGWKVRDMRPGRVVVWGSDYQGVLDRPYELSDPVAIASGFNHCLAARENGTVIAWGSNDWGAVDVPSGLSNVVSVAAGNDHSLALKADGTIVAWGKNNYGQCNIPSGLSNAIVIAANGNQGMALKKDGTVTNWGSTFGAIPSNLTNAIAIAAGGDFCLALRSNGTVSGWGDNDQGQTNIPTNLSNVVAIAAGGLHGMALMSNGTIVAWGANGYGQTNVPSGLTNVMAIACGYAHSLALKNDGTVLAWGDNSGAQTNVFPGLISVKSIAGGGAHSLALVFSDVLQYTVDVSKDLLLIYNTNFQQAGFIRNKQLDRSYGRELRKYELCPG